ncbi:TonB-dependent receptor plug domain-containing protein [Cyclobacterium amurskyense]|uniref:TonB-dependent receptor n=1 Tax=Cyclobacterium amurskyense TaxID=320787 RepID=A0A0H4PET3_9BACT|nr:TonB-dependent receptor [Cyclobacterium amurskyense]AKP51605.1 TonB-dependent receptor [Cyclobacterium amurskyense]
MIRINLIKLNMMVLFLLYPLIGHGAEGDKIIVNNYGNPLPQAVVQVDQLPPIVAGPSGEISLGQLGTGDSVLVFALGHESKQFSWAEWSMADVIVLKEKEGELNEVVVSATRTDRTVADLPMPVSVIGKKVIQETGGIRLSEVLSEQTGLQIVSNHGTGLQMQGLDTDYILILLDGEPLIGRTAGTFDLNRISVSNIERIEILKGPASAIYGSEAMAGVVNIITKSAGQGKKIDLGLRQRSFNTWNPYLDFGIREKKWNVDVLYDYYRTDGYDLSPEVTGKTQNPYQSHSAQVKLGTNLGAGWNFNVFFRGYTEQATGLLEVEESSGPALLDVEDKRKEININPTLRYKPNNDWLITLRNMSTLFSTNSDTRYQKEGKVFDIQEFDQIFQRTELQSDYQINQKQLLTLGLGFSGETVEATRYDDRNHFDATYFYLQHQWDASDKINIVSGARGDFHSVFGSRVSPKLSGQYKFSDTFSWQLSIGSGFKAPDFRQLLLNFNNASAGYYVFGSSVANEALEKLEEKGLVAKRLIQPENLGELKAEHSWAVNTGFRWKPAEAVLVQLNGYRNDLQNMIETAPIAQLVSGQNAFSYFNISQVITQGVDVDLQYKWNDKLSFGAGYAYLDTRDLDVLDQIDNGEIYKRNTSNQTVRVTRADYGGLFNRSAHSGNFKVNYLENRTGINWALRVLYRGKFGFSDLNGNLILDDEREFAPGYFNVNLTATKKFDNGFLVESGVNNLLNTTNLAQPNMPGRLLFVGIKIPLLNL